MMHNNYYATLFITTEWSPPEGHDCICLSSRCIHHKAKVSVWRWSNQANPDRRWFGHGKWWLYWCGNGCIGFYFDGDNYIIKIILLYLKYKLSWYTCITVSALSCYNYYHQFICDIHFCQPLKLMLQCRSSYNIIFMDDHWLCSNITFKFVIMIVGPMATYKINNLLV